jgi:hypothetical protein
MVSVHATGRLTLLAAVIGASASHVAAAPLIVDHLAAAGSLQPVAAAHYRRSGLHRLNPWQAPYHVSHLYRGGPGARMGLVAQGIIPPPPRSFYSYPGFYWNNYFYYPNYRMIYDF